MPRHSLILCALIAADVAAASTLPTNPPTVTALPADHIKLDGRLNERTWTRGTWYSGFRVLDLPEEKAGVQTRFQVRFDAAHLYVAVQADEPRPDSLRAAIRQRDAKVYHDDCVEVMLDPTGERTEYYHFVINSKGVLYDAHRRQAGYVNTAEWNSTATAAAHVGAGRWSVELSIPVVELGLAAGSRRNWAINVARERQVKPPELSTYAPLTGGFHQPAQYAPLRLPGADFERFLWEMQAPAVRRVEPWPEGPFRMHCDLDLRNAGSAQRAVQIRARLDERTGPWRDAVVAADESQQLELMVPVSRLGRRELVVELVDAKDTTLVLARRHWQQDIEYRPLQVQVLRPAYRNAIYATQKLDTLAARVRSDLDEAQLRGLERHAALLDSAGAALVSETLPAAKGSWIRLPLPELTPATYRLVVSLRDPGGAVHHRQAVSMRRLPAVPDEWRIDAQGVLRHNGEAVLPFGWFSMPPDAMEEPGHAYNLMQSYGYYTASVDQTRGFLDRVAAAGTAVALYPYPGSRFMRPASVWGEPLTDTEARALRQRVRALKDHPGLFAWYMADEPELRPALPERCEQIYQVVRDEDPYHPCIMLNDTMAGIRRFSGGGDVLMPDPYPCFLKDGLAASPIEKVSHYIRTATAASGPGQAVWITPQGFNYADYGKSNQRAPRFVELRNMLYQAVVSGARGFLWYTYAHTHNYPDLGIGMPWLSLEVADLRDAILALPADAPVEVEAPDPQHIHTSARRSNQEWTVFAVNTATHAQQVTLFVPGLPAPSLHVVSETRAVPVRDERWSDAFEPYDVHIYTTDAVLGARENLQVPLKRIAAADAARRKPGNLAFEDHGTRVECSSESQYGSTPDRVVDGVTHGMRWRDGTRGALPDWLTVRWPAPVTLNRVVVYSGTIAAAEIQVRNDSRWRSVAVAATSNGDRLEASLPEPVRTSALRVMVTALRPDEEYSIMYEVEAYGPSPN